VVARVKSGGLRLTDGAVLMRVSYRQAKRLWKRYQAGGVARLKHANAGRSGNCISIRSSSLQKVCVILWPSVARARSCSAPTIHFPGAPPPSIKVFKTPGLSDADRRAILGETAARLLKIKV